MPDTEIGLNIKTRFRPDGEDWKAELIATPGVWEAGKTEAEAIGKLFKTLAASRNVFSEGGEYFWDERLVKTATQTV